MMTQPTNIQSAAIITLSSIARYFIQHCTGSNITEITVSFYKRHPISHPNGWYMGCPLVRIFFRKLAILYYKDTVLYLVDPIECTWFRFCCGLVAVDLPISFKVTSLALGQPYGCPNTSEVTLRNKGKCLPSLEIMNKHNRTKHINKSIRIFHGT